MDGSPRPAGLVAGAARLLGRGGAVLLPLTCEDYTLRMSAPAIEAIEPASVVAGSLNHALAEVDRLLRQEMNRSRHITLSGIRQDLATGLAHLGSLKISSLMDGEKSDG